ncbi:MAG: YdiU family protein [Bacteriovoracia bacterium]
MSKSMFGFSFDNTYSALPEQFFAHINPTPVKAPKMAIFNHDFAKTLGLDAEALSQQPEIFAGNKILEGAEPIAQAYAGHQFGHFNMLGDGRANLLGEHVTPSKERFDIQLKGSGPTPFSRRGDGRAALGPMLREYIISEAMHALRIPTTRSLAVVTTGEPVFREQPLPGAVLTRVASSHIRVGTFEYAAALEKEKPGSLKILADYTLQRHYPELASQAEPYLALLLAVMERQASLIANWMCVGFIHGVMNTDNMALSGETIDYGPCAFMDHYSHSTLFSSIDRNGRYAYGNQPKLAGWNLARLGEALLPLLHENQELAVAKAQEVLARFPGMFETQYLRGMRAKLGLVSDDAGDITLINDLLALMELHKSDYTNTFRALSAETLPSDGLFAEAAFREWYARWKLRQPSSSLMRSSNPVVIPRNHRVEEALAAAVEREDYAVMGRLLAALRAPYEEADQNMDYRATPIVTGEEYKTFCGT